jgi:hypothetical protein
MCDGGAVAAQDCQTFDILTNALGNAFYRLLVVYGYLKDNLYPIGQPTHNVIDIL